MPREVKAYGCEYKCGKKVVLSKKSMTDHESRCFHNPEKKACVTCFYFEKEADGDHTQDWVNLICKAKDEQLNKLQNNCELYEPK